jgi:hypothetical protein
MTADDAFYYLNIAKNIINHSFSSFDGLTETNGYQPLWLFILVILGKIINIDSNFSFFIILVLLPILCTSFGAYFLCSALLSVNNSYKKYLFIIIPYYFYIALPISSRGMESCLIFLFFPLFFLTLIKFLNETNQWTALYVAFWGSLLILSRLDTIILVGSIYILCIIISIKNKNLIKILVFFLVGSLPLILYLAYNYTQFGNFIPISGQAKGLKSVSFFISPGALSSIKKRIIADKHLQFQLLIILSTMPLLIKNLVVKKRAFDYALFLITIFPFIYFPITSMRSDWGLWFWYFYPIMLSSSVSFAILTSSLCKYFKFSSSKITYILIIIFIFYSSYQGFRIYSHRYNYSKVHPVLCAALKIKTFSIQNPGIYAMGDRSGAVGYLLSYPLIQLEGLVCDTAMINNISSQKNLIDVLAEYNVDYYIATKPIYKRDIWYFKEPAMGGYYIPRMKAIFTSQPVYSFDCGNGTSKNEFITHIFKITADTVTIKQPRF